MALASLLKKAQGHLDPGETVLASVGGFYETKRAGTKHSKNGALIATTQRLVFYAKKLGGYDMEIFPYRNISSIEFGKGLMGHKVAFFASGNDVTVKWISEGDVPEFVRTVRARMEGQPVAAGDEAMPEPPRASVPEAMQAMMGETRENKKKPGILHRDIGAGTGCLLVLLFFMAIGMLGSLLEPDPEPIDHSKFLLPKTDRPESASKSQEAKPDPEKAEPIEPKVEWKAHEFKIVQNKDISSSNRNRRRVAIVARTALTREDRIATLVKAVRQVWKQHHSQFITASLWPYEKSGPPLAMIDYAPDKCGVSGEDCTGQMWTNARASDVVLMPEREKYQIAWEENRDKFLEQDEFGKILNETRLVAYLAKQFDTTPEHIKETVSFYYSQKDMFIPARLKVSAPLSEADKKKAEEAACRANLQCWGDKHSIAASVYCPDHIERLAKYAHEWTDGWLGSKFDRFGWKDRKQGIVTYFGDKIRFQNGFGAWIPHSYKCDYDTQNEKVISVSANPGRL